MKGKTVGITGGTSGIGEVAAEALAQMGARIVSRRREYANNCASPIVHQAGDLRVKAKYEKEVATLQRELAQARAELSKLQMLDVAKRERSEATTVN
jgi:NAD(P)-dependent dehydrogenase (short-subunit alcohol dehydrogenase family)